MGLIGDNASNNDTMIDCLNKLLTNAPGGSHTRVRRIAHILNLVVQAGIRPFKAKKGEVTDPEEDEQEDDACSDIEEDSSDEEDKSSVGKGKRQSSRGNGAGKKRKVPLIPDPIPDKELDPQRDQEDTELLDELEGIPTETLLSERCIWLVQATDDEWSVAKDGFRKVQFRNTNHFMSNIQIRERNWLLAYSIQVPFSRN